MEWKVGTRCSPAARVDIGDTGQLKAAPICTNVKCCRGIADFGQELAGWGLGSASLRLVDSGHGQSLRKGSFRRAAEPLSSAHLESCGYIAQVTNPLSSMSVSNFPSGSLFCIVLAKAGFGAASKILQENEICLAHQLFSGKPYTYHNDEEVLESVNSPMGSRPSTLQQEITLTLSSPAY